MDRHMAEPRHMEGHHRMKDRQHTLKSWKLSCTKSWPHSSEAVCVLPLKCENPTNHLE